VRSGRLRGVAGFGPKSEERILRGIAVAVSNAVLRDALRSLSPDAGEDDIYAVLAAHVERPKAAEIGPALIRTEDLRGDLHTHTDLTDGIVSLEGMVAAAEARGYEYYAVTDHAPNLVMQRMTDEKMLAQRDQLRALADSTGMVLLHGTELNIAADGSVDWDENFLSGFDICVASVQTENPVPKHVNLQDPGVPALQVPRATGPAPAARFLRHMQAGWAGVSCDSGRLKRQQTLLARHLPAALTFGSADLGPSLRQGTWNVAVMWDSSSHERTRRAGLGDDQGPVGSRQGRRHDDA
jgi:hypothetical protein